MKQIRDHFLEIVRNPPDHKLAKKLAMRFEGDRAEDYFRFMAEPMIELTNNGMERDICHMVIDRRVTQGTHGEAGIRWRERVSGQPLPHAKNKAEMFSTLSISPFLTTGQNNLIHNYCERLPINNELASLIDD